MRAVAGMESLGLSAEVDRAVRVEEAFRLEKVESREVLESTG